MKFRVGVLGVLVLCLFIVEATAQAGNTTGNITVYVKDQSGDNVNCYASNVFCINQINDNLTIEILKDGKPINSTIMPNDRDTVFFKVNQTGSYVVRASVSLGFRSMSRLRCVLNASSYSDQRDNCSVVCSRLVNNLVSGGAPFTWVNGNFSVLPDALDRSGAYYCGNMVCGFEGGNKVCYYDTDHRYTQVNEVLTYVDANESDVAQVSLFTDFGTLGKMGLAYGKDFFNLTEVEGIDSGEVIVGLDDLVEYVAEEEFDDALEVEGQHNITVVTDPADYLPESNETNNYVTMSIDLLEENNAVTLH
jgi:hypothetical protein